MDGGESRFSLTLTRVLALEQTVTALDVHRGNTLNPPSIALAVSSLCLILNATDYSTRAELGRPKASKLTALRFAPDGSTIAAATRDSRVLVWHIASRDTRAVLVGHSAPVLDMLFFSSTILATAAQDGSVRLWNLANRVDPRTKELSAAEQFARHGASITSLASYMRSNVESNTNTSADGRVAVAGLDGKVGLWDIQKQTMLGTATHTRSAIGEKYATREEGSAHIPILAVAISPDCRYMAAADSKHAVHLWSVVSFSKDHIVSSNSSDIVAAADSRRKGTMPHSSLIRVADYELPSTETTLLSRTSAPHLLGDASVENEIKIYRPEHSASRLMPDEYEDMPLDAGYHADHLLQLSHDAPCLAVAFTANSEFVLTTSIDCTIKVWDCETGYLVYQVNAPAPVSRILICDNAVLACCANRLLVFNLYQRMSSAEMPTALFGDDWKAKAASVLERHRKQRETELSTIISKMYSGGFMLGPQDVAEAKRRREEKGQLPARIRGKTTEGEDGSGTAFKPAVNVHYYSWSESTPKNPIGFQRAAGGKMPTTIPSKLALNRAYAHGALPAYVIARMLLASLSVDSLGGLHRNVSRYPIQPEQLLRAALNSDYDPVDVLLALSRDSRDTEFLYQDVLERRNIDSIMARLGYKKSNVDLSSYLMVSSFGRGGRNPGAATAQGIGQHRTQSEGNLHRGSPGRIGEPVYRTTTGTSPRNALQMYGSPGSADGFQHDPWDLAEGDELVERERDQFMSHMSQSYYHESIYAAQELHTGQRAKLQEARGISNSKLREPLIRVPKNYEPLPPFSSDIEKFLMQPLEQLKKFKQLEPIGKGGSGTASSPSSASPRSAALSGGSPRAASSPRRAQAQNATLSSPRRGDKSNNSGNSNSGANNSRIRIIDDIELPDLVLQPFGSPSTQHQRDQRYLSGHAANDHHADEAARDVSPRFPSANLEDRYRYLDLVRRGSELLESPQPGSPRSMAADVHPQTHISAGQGPLHVAGVSSFHDGQGEFDSTAKEQQQQLGRQVGGAVPHHHSGSGASDVGLQHTQVAGSASLQVLKQGILRPLLFVGPDLIETPDSVHRTVTTAAVDIPVRTLVAPQPTAAQQQRGPANPLGRATGLFVMGMSISFDTQGRNRGLGYERIVLGRDAGEERNQILLRYKMM